jgi:pilus assembly protein Flp/PilA
MFVPKWRNFFKIAREQSKKLLTVRRYCGRLSATRSSRMSKVFAFLKDEAGATAIEYGLIVGGIAVVIITAVNTIGSTLNTKFQYISDQLKP